MDVDQKQSWIFFSQSCTLTTLALIPLARILFDCAINLLAISVILLFISIPLFHSLSPKTLALNHIFCWLL